MLVRGSAHAKPPGPTNKGLVHPVPPGVTAVIANGPKKSIFVLYKDHQVIVIQLPLHPDRNQDPNVKLTLEFVLAANRRYYEELEQIQMLLDRIEFGKSNWVYAVKNSKGGGYDLVHRTRRKRQLTCHTWARLIPRRDIKFTNFYVIFNIWNGYWNGHEVDCLMGFEDWTIENLDRHMWAYLALQGLDITYHVFGHIVEDDGTIVGIVQEARFGRLMQHRDRSIVYDAYSRMQQRGLIYCGATEFFNTHIMDGKVRISALHTVWYFADEHACKRQGEIRHWGPLDAAFRKLKERKDTSPGLCFYREWAAIPKLIARFSPDRPLFINLEDRLVMEKKEDIENRYRAIQAWLRKTERSRKELIYMDGKPSSSRAGLVRREKTISENRLQSRPSCRNGVDGSSNIIVVPYNEVSRKDRRKVISGRMESPFSDAESEETAVEYASASAVDAQSLQPSSFRPDKGSDSDSDSDDALKGYAVALSWSSLPLNPPSLA